MTNPGRGRRSTVKAQNVFVGRRREMTRLDGALDSALAGQGQVVMLSGEPGIGKTRIAQELAAIADTRNADVFWGHCYEGKGAPPYWPWLRIIRSCIDQSDAERLDAAMGPGAEAIGEIVPELRSKLPDLKTPPTLDPDSARFRLFDSITTYLKNASGNRPLLLILEDLHWADASSLALLEHVASDMAASSLLIFGLYRDIEVPLDHPLSRTMGSLVRHQGFQSLQLGGLSQADVGELVTFSAGSDATPDMVEKVHRRTEGNALFVVELLKLLEASGLDEPQEWQFAIPQGIRGVISKRFDGLSDRCNQALTVASVIGREFDFDLLSQMTGSSDDDLLDVVDEAVEAHVIEDMRGALERYRFSHALIEQTLYERQTTSRRARLHARIGETLEGVYGEDVEAHASELVRHFSRSPRRQDSEKVLRYGKLAANQAASVYAYSEAAAYLEQCLDVQKSLDPDDDETRCDMLIALGEGLIVAGEPQRAFEDIAPEAFAMAEARDDSDQAFRSCRIALQGINTFGAYTGLSMSEYRQWAERADRLADPETTDRVEADLAMAAQKYVSREYPDTWYLLHRALRLARQLDDPEYLVRCSQAFLGWQWPPEYQKELFEIAREAADSPVPDATPRLRGEFLVTVVKYLRLNGDGDRTRRMSDQFIAFVERTKIPHLRALALGGEIRSKTYEGELEGAVEAIDHLIVGSEELGSAAFGLQFAASLGIIPLLYLGRAEEALAHIPQARQYVGLEPDLATSESLPDNYAQFVLCLAHAGHLTEAREFFSLVMKEIGDRLAERQEDVRRLGDLTETAVLLRDVDAAKTLADQLEEMTGSPGIARRLGEAANLSGEWDRAKGYFHQALKVSTDMRDRPESALSRFDMAELMLSHYPDQRDEALEHLDFAIAEFRDMKMQPSLDRALALKDSAESGPIPKPALSDRLTALPDGLTRREAQVLRLIATGSSNKEVADELLLSVRTIERHITNIYRKIDARGRADAVTYALRHHLIDSS